MRGVWMLALGLGGGWAMGTTAGAAESAFPKTPAGVSELKQLPAAVRLVAQGGGTYDDQANGLFMSLFRYIRANGIAMTVPVEGAMDRAVMRFYVGVRDRAKAVQTEGGVRVEPVEARWVASHGWRGPYEDRARQAALDELTKWLAQRQDLRPKGDAYAVYWNGPLVPGFLKRGEVHQPVERVLPE